MSKSNSWTNSLVDLNLRHYAGRPSDIIKYIKLKIEEEIRNHNISSEQDIKVYSAIYNALDYYRAVTYLPDAENETEETFLSHTLKELNKDLKYLSKYNEMYPNDSPVITMSARIKSPLSFLEKTKKKIDEYIQEGRDLSHLNESLRDLIGIQVIINTPNSIKKQGKQAESDFLYEVYLDLMRHHGIYNPNQNELLDGQYNFINVNTKHNPHKNQDLKDRVKLEGFDEGVEETIFIPSTRHLEMEHPLVDSKTKDYNMFPKKNGYQSLHTCVIPYYSKSLGKSVSSPTTINDPAPYNCCLEYIFETQEQHEHSKSGLSARNTYKPFEQVYHRCAVPTFILPNEDGKFHIKNFADSLEIFYNISFADLFKIPFDIFRDKFPTSTRNKILALRSEVLYDKETNTYSSKDIPMPAAIPSFLQKKFIELLEVNQNAAIKFLEFLGVIDSRYYIDEDTNIKDLGNIPPKLYSIETPSASQIKIDTDGIDKNDEDDKKQEDDYSELIDDDIIPTSE